MSKPILSLKKKKTQLEVTPETETKSKVNSEEIPVNPIAAIEITEWDYTSEEDFTPRQRKRRKDKEVEQYRKEARWQ